MLITGFILIGVVYQYHVWNYPPERQTKDSQVFLAAYPDLVKGPVLWATDKPILRPYAHYLTGLLMALNRATSGNTTYFLGEVSNQGWKIYFPTVYLIKESLTFHILSLFALLFAVWQIKKPFWQNTFQRTKGWIAAHFSEFSMLCFIALYWATSLTSTLNIGVRHLLPTFPFVMLLTAGMIEKINFRLKYPLLFLLIFWQIFSVVRVYPHFLAYFNELAGGPDGGYIYTVDSNLDWGQDLKRLTEWVNKNLPVGSQVKVAYFGGGDPSYYLKDRVEYFTWEEPQKGWVAISVTLLQGGRGKPAPGFNQPSSYFNWLDQYTPATKIGYSIFIYHIE